jgi:chromosome segregation ATPase
MPKAQTRDPKFVQQQRAIEEKDKLIVQLRREVAESNAALHKAQQASKESARAHSDEMENMKLAMGSRIDGFNQQISDLRLDVDTARTRQRQADADLKQTQRRLREKSEALGGAQQAANDAGRMLSEFEKTKERHDALLKDKQERELYVKKLEGLLMLAKESVVVMRAKLRMKPVEGISDEQRDGKSVAAGAGA